MGSVFLPLRRKEFRTSRPEKNERKAESEEDEIERLRGKGKTLLKKGFSPFPAPLSPFLKLLLLQAVFLFSGRTNDVFFHRPACRCTRCRKAQAPCDRLASAASRLHKACCTACITCTTAAVLNAGSEFRLLAAVGATDIFLLPNAETARLRRTHCTNTRPARRALRLTAGVNPACLCPSAGLLTSPGAPVR